MNSIKKVYYHLPGLFEFFEFYQKFLSLYKNHREYFYDWCDIGSIYGSPDHCIWAGGRIEISHDQPQEVLNLMQEYGISARLTFSNSLLKKEHLKDYRCNALCQLFHQRDIKNGVIVYQDILVDYLRENYPDLYLVSSTTKVLTKFDQLVEEINRDEFQYVVPDFRLNKAFKQFQQLSQKQKDKVEFLCNECCYFGCKERKLCYETVSRQNLGEDCLDFKCQAPDLKHGYSFSKAMENPGFISIKDIQDIYMPLGFSHFKIEGRGLGSALILEFIIYYMVKPQYHIHVREYMYLDNMLDLF